MASDDQRETGSTRPAYFAPGVTDGQQRVLDLLKRRGAMTIPLLSEPLALNVETVRHHLRGLERSGYVTRLGARRAGPGRPEVVYGLTPRAESLFPRAEGDVLAALAGYLKSTGNASLLEAFFDSYIGARRSEALARVDGLAGEARVEEVARIMSELGFMAKTEPGRGDPRLHLCHCPLRDLVEVSRIPCRAELRFVRELLGEPLTRLAYIPSGDSSCSYSAKAS